MCDFNTGVDFYMSGKAKVFYTIDDSRASCCLNSIEGDLEELYIPASINDIPVNEIDLDGLAEGIKNIKSFVVSKQNQHFKEVDGVLFSKDGRKLILYPPRKATSVVYIPGAVEIIADSAFSGNQHIRKIVLPHGVRVISEFAFGNCGNLSEICIPASIQEIQRDSFKKTHKNMNVYYGGNVHDWNNVIVEDENSNLVLAHMHFSLGYEMCGKGELGLNFVSNIESTDFIEKILIRSHIINSFIRFHNSNSQELHNRISKFTNYFTDYEKYLYSTSYGQVKNRSIYADYIHSYSMVAVFLWSIGMIESFPCIGEVGYCDFGMVERIKTSDDVKNLMLTSQLRDQRELDISLLDSMLKYWRIWLCNDFDYTEKHLIDVIQDNFGESIASAILKLGVLDENVEDYEVNERKISLIKEKYSIMVSSKWICLGLLQVADHTYIPEDSLFEMVEDLIKSKVEQSISQISC